MTELRKYLLTCLLGFVTEFACFAANSLAKTIFIHSFRHGFRFASPMAIYIIPLQGKPCHCCFIDLYKGQKTQNDTLVNTKND